VRVRVDWRWLLLSGILSTVPVALSLPRTTEFTASVRLVSATGESRPSSLAANVQRQLGSAHVRNNVVEASGFLVNPRAVADHVRVAAEMEAVRLTARADTATRASALAHALGALIVGESGGRLVLAETQEPRRTHALDRFIDGLPGKAPPRPHPLLAAAAGLALVALIWGSTWYRRLE
jgi:hypothetical protein